MKKERKDKTKRTWHWNWNIRTKSWGIFDREFCEGDYRWSR